jgi:hypothetical protein
MVKNDSYPIGYLYNYSWATAADDSRQVAYMNQFMVDLNDYNSDDTQVQSPYLLTFRDMVPELGRYLADKDKSDVVITLQKVESLFPHWYAAYAEGTLGWEHNLAHPVDSFQIFLGKAYIQQTDGATLARYTDISWLSDGGDLFYMQKLAEAIKSYQGVSWGDTVYLKAHPKDQQIALEWNTSAAPEATDSWRIETDPVGGSPQTPITGIPASARAYTLTGMTNYVIYTIVLRLMDADNQAILSTDPIIGFATDRMTFLPVISR